MHTTSRLCAQHLGWTFKKHWKVQGSRVVLDTTAATPFVKSCGAQIKDAKELFLQYNFKSYKPQQQESADCVDGGRNDWPYSYGNENILVGGLPQAQILTNTIEIKRLPHTIHDIINKTSFPHFVDRNIQNIIVAAHMLDAEQTKLAKISEPNRPGYNLPRAYGIDHERRIRLLISKTLAEVEKFASSEVVVRRKIIDNVDFSGQIKKNGDSLHFQVSSAKMISSASALEMVKEACHNQLPDIYPLKYTISIPRKEVSANKFSYPLAANTSQSHPHTLFINFNNARVSNLHQLGITTSQFQSRSLLITFAVAVARAQQLYKGKFPTELPKPITVQSIHTDGRTFHFGVFQLNTLNLGDNSTSGLKNYWFHEPAMMDWFVECGSKSGKPLLEGYNKNVFRYINAFYNNS